MLPFTTVEVVNTVPSPLAFVNHPPNSNPLFIGAVGRLATFVAGSVTVIELGFAAVSAF